MQAALGRTFALSGKRKSRYVSPFELASVHLALGQGDEGFEWPGKAFQAASS
jgi:hypothetical protein